MAGAGTRSRPGALLRETAGPATAEPWLIPVDHKRATLTRCGYLKIGCSLGYDIAGC